MDIRAHTLSANARTPIHIPGRFFMLVETGGPLDVEFERKGSPRPEVARDAEAGYVSQPGDWTNPEDNRFDAVVLTSATNQTVRIGISQTSADYRRTVGVVEIEQPDDGSTTADASVTGTQSTIAAANTSRRKVVVQNVSAAGVNMRVGIGTVTASRGIQLQPGMTMTFDTTAAIVAIREGASNATAAVVEETRT